MREALHGKNEDYQVFWPEKTDFVRVAAKFNATIVPLAAIGAADSVEILLDAPELLQLPFGVGGEEYEASFKYDFMDVSPHFSINIKKSPLLTSAKMPPLQDLTWRIVMNCSFRPWLSLNHLQPGTTFCLVALLTPLQLTLKTRILARRCTKILKEYSNLT